MSNGGKETVKADDAVVAASEVRLSRSAGARVGVPARKNPGSRSPEGGARIGAGKKMTVALAAARRYPMKTVSDTLGVARSNVI